MFLNRSRNAASSKILSPAGGVLVEDVALFLKDIDCVAV